jgi:hypothetical protein
MYEVLNSEIQFIVIRNKDILSIFGLESQIVVLPMFILPSTRKGKYFNTTK